MRSDLKNVSLNLMRKESFGLGDYVHIYNRGNRKQPIVNDITDKDHFLQMLFYFNTEVTPPNPFSDLRTKLRSDLNEFIWPDYWQPREPIVKILAFILMKNHFHLILNEVKEDGIAKFMQRLGTGMTMYYNTKYQETGRLFQGAYKAKLIDKDVYLKYLNVYIQVKNGFELYNGGFEAAMKDFDKAYKWVTEFPYGSLSHYYGKVTIPIVDKNLFLEMFTSSYDYKNLAKECMLDLKNRLGELTFESTEIY